MFSSVLPTLKTPFGHSLRPYWSLDPSVTFLNHGSYGATPRYVQAAQAGWRSEMEFEPVRFMQDELPQAYLDACSKLAAFVGVAPANLAFVENATAGANAVMRSIDWQPGDKVVIANHGYPALKNTLRYLAGREKFEVIEANVPWPVHDASEVVNAYLAAIRIAGGACRLVVVDHIFSPLAIETPLAEIAAACRAQGSKLLVDGAHAPVLLPLAIETLFESGVDWYVGNCHKWLCAPKGAAFLAAAPHAQAGLHPTVISNYYGEGFQREFGWCGTGDFSAKLSVPAAIQFIEALGVERYREYLRKLASDAAQMIAAAWKVSLPAPLSMCHSMVTIPLPIDELASAEGVVRWRTTLLREHGIEVPIHAINGKLHVRISAQVYNEMSDYEKLAGVFGG
jgi:isopenicillin-N epimerase